MNEKAQCLYRGPKGLKCAIGCLIVDESYNECLEMRTLVTYEVRQAVWRSIGRDPQSSATTHAMLIALQKLHDEISPERWDDNLHEIAAAHNLSSVVVSKTLLDLDRQA